MEAKRTIGIIREVKSKWERRCAVTPRQVQELVADGSIRVLVQPSPSRCYTDEEFEEVGAEITEDLSPCDVIFGVKEVPIADLIEGKTYFFFSHTIKAQEYNMPLLDAMLQKRIRMIDYECIREREPAPGQSVPNRLVAFGRYAGIAGTFDFLRGVGEFMLQKKLQTPFIFMGSTYMYEDYEAMKVALASVAKGISKSGTPKQFGGPLVFAVTGTGRVAQGILEVVEQLPHVKVDPDDLKRLPEIVGADTKKIVIAQFSQKHLVKHKDGHAFDKADYYANPTHYETKYCEDYLPYVHFFINGVYWDAKYPRIISINELRDGVLAGTSKLMGVCDISADYMGSVEFTKRFTSIEHPFLLYDPITEDFAEKMDDMKDNSILFHSVDHLPAEMPKEASNHFGEQLMQFVKPVAHSNASLDFADQADLPEEIRSAVICCHGKLTPKYEYITELRRLRDIAKQHQQDYMQHVQEAERKTSSLRRGIRFATVVFNGHLFDTKFFNITIDIFEQCKIDFRVLEWQVGTKNQNTSQVTMQLMAQEAKALDEAKGLIEKEAIEKGIIVSEAESGPAFDQSITEHVPL